MANLSQILQQQYQNVTGLSANPAEVAKLVADSFAAPFQQFIDAVKPESLFNNVLNAAGLGQLPILFKSITDSLSFQKKTQEQETSANKETNNELSGIRKILSEIMDFLKRKERTDIEDRRESGNGGESDDGGPTPPADQSDSTFGFLGTLGMFISKIGVFAKALLPVIGVALSLLTTTERDWEIFTSNLVKDIEAFQRGDWLEGIIGLFGTILDLPFKGIGRLLAIILNWTGFEDESKQLTEFLDNFSLRDLFLQIKGVVKNIASFFEGLFQDLTLTQAAFLLNFRLVSATVSGIFNTFTSTFIALVNQLKRITIIKTVFDTVTGAFESLSTAFNTIRQSITTSTGVVGKIVSAIQNVASSMMSFIRGAGSSVFGWISSLVAGPAKILGRLFFPVTIIMGLIDAVREFMNTEGNTFEKIVAGIGGFLGEIIGAPLDLIKNIASWVLGKFGFDPDSEAMKALNEFSFEQLIQDIIGSIGEMVTSAINWIKTLFTDPVQALTDFITLQVGPWISIGNWIFNNAIDPAFKWLTEKFGWTDEGGEGYSLSGLISDTFEKLKIFFAELFDFLPSVEEVRIGLTNYIRDSVPETVGNWLFGERELTAEERQQREEEERLRQIEELSDRIEELREERELSPYAENESWFWRGRTKEEIDQELESMRQQMRMLMEQPQQAPVIINNTNNNMSSGATQAPATNLSTNTTPRQSDLDRYTQSGYIGAI